MADLLDLAGNVQHGPLDEAGLVELFGFLEVTVDDLVGKVDLPAAEVHVFLGQYPQVLDGDVSKIESRYGGLGYVGGHAQVNDDLPGSVFAGKQVPEPLGGNDRVRGSRTDEEYVKSTGIGIQRIERQAFSFLEPGGQLLGPGEGAVGDGDVGIPLLAQKFGDQHVGLSGPNQQNARPATRCVALQLLHR